MAEQLTEGWGAPGCSRKFHYFRGGLSLCRKIGFYNGELDPDDGTKREDDCAACRKALERDKKRAARCKP